MVEGKIEEIEVIEELGEEEKKKKGRRGPISIPPFLYYIPILLIIAFGGYYIYKNFFAASPEIGKTEEKSVELARVAVKRGVMFPAWSLVINLADANVPRFLKVSFTFELDRAITVAEMQEKEPIIKDAIIGLISSKTMADMRGYEAQLILKEEIISRLNAILETGRVINVYFTEFIVQ